MGIWIRKRHFLGAASLKRKMGTWFQLPFASAARWLCAGYRQHRFTWSFQELRSHPAFLQRWSDNLQEKKWKGLPIEWQSGLRDGHLDSLHNGLQTWASILYKTKVARLELWPLILNCSAPLCLPRLPLTQFSLKLSFCMGIVSSLCLSVCLSLCFETGSYIAQDSQRNSSWPWTLDSPPVSVRA